MVTWTCHTCSAGSSCPHRSSCRSRHDECCDCRRTGHGSRVCGAMAKPVCEGTNPRDRASCASFRAQEVDSRVNREEAHSAGNLSEGSECDALEHAEPGPGHRHLVQERPSHSPEPATQTPSGAKVQSQQ